MFRTVTNWNKEDEEFNHRKQPLIADDIYVSVYSESSSPFLNLKYDDGGTLN